MILHRHKYRNTKTNKSLTIFVERLIVFFVEHHLHLFASANDNDLRKFAEADKLLCFTGFMSEIRDFS
jgi:hypothetical protein